MNYWCTIATRCLPDTHSFWFYFIFSTATTFYNYFWTQAVSKSSCLTQTHAHYCTISVTYTYVGFAAHNHIMLFLTCLSLAFSQKWKSSYLRTACLFPGLPSCLLTFHVFWQPAPFLFSSPLSVALEPNYPQRTQRFYHKAGSRSSVHHTHYTGLLNSQHTYCCLRRGVDKAVSNPPLIWHQVQIHPQFWFQSGSLEGYFANCVSYVLYWSQAAFCLLATFYSPLEQMEVCYLQTVKNNNCKH